MEPCSLVVQFQFHPSTEDFRPGILFGRVNTLAFEIMPNALARLGYDISMLAVVGMSSPSLAALLEHKRKCEADSGAAAAGV